ncbi:hypothetical protein WG66_012917 [Moniliophthora roreri]|nr:hypothetical protein WG66_012917 [Moniliophthora roreri]
MLLRLRLSDSKAMGVENKALLSLATVKHRTQKSALESDYGDEKGKTGCVRRATGKKTVLPRMELSLLTPTLLIGEGKDKSTSYSPASE